MYTTGVAYKRQSPCSRGCVELALSAMDDAKTLTFYLSAPMRERAQAGRTNIINRISNVFELRGYRCLFQGNSAVDLLTSAKDPGYSIFHNEDPFHPRALNLRRAYYYPFWSLETSAKRWDWTVAKASFDPGRVDRGHAQKFVSYWRKKKFGDPSGQPDADGYIFAPLQGRLQQKRGFQTMSPLDMLRATLDADRSRQIQVSLHPRETYSEIEIQALEALIADNPRLTMANVDSADLVRGCDYVVTQNSSLALDGYFLRKPAILFAAIDFHHIGHNVADLGVKRAFAGVLADAPEFDAYLYWFLQLHSINAGREDAEAKVLASVRAKGWDV